MKEKTNFLFLLLLVINLISASKTAKQHGSKIAKRSKPITKPGKSDSVAGYLVRTNKGKIYLAKGKKRTETETDLGGLDQGKKSKKTETDIEGLNRGLNLGFGTGLDLPSDIAGLNRGLNRVGGHWKPKPTEWTTRPSKSGCRCNGHLHLDRGECMELSASGCGHWCYVDDSNDCLDARESVYGAAYSWSCEACNTWPVITHPSKWPPRTTTSPKWPPRTTTTTEKEPHWTTTTEKEPHWTTTTTTTGWTTWKTTTETTTWTTTTTTTTWTTTTTTTAWTTTTTTTRPPWTTRPTPSPWTTRPPKWTTRPSKWSHHHDEEEEEEEIGKDYVAH